jgi:hypothetical protein
MSSFTVTNTTNGKTNTLANTLTANNLGQTIPGYKQAGVSISAGLITNAAIEATTTGYKTSGTDLGNLYCAKYIEYRSGETGGIDVSNYSSCTIVMCGGGGGGAGGGSGPASGYRPGGPGGKGGINIIQKIPLAGVTTINYNVGNGGDGGRGATTPTQTGGFVGTAGNDTVVSISGTTYTAGGGSRGPQRGGPTPPTTPGTINPATQNFTTATLNGGLAGGTVTYNSGPDIVIQVVGTNYAQGGSGGNRASLSAGNSGQAGRPGYLRIYLYP